MTGRTALLRFVLPSICGALGTWQISRWHQKRQLLDELAETLQRDPKSIESLKEIPDESAFSKYSIEPKSTGQRALLGPRGLSAPLFYGYTLFESAQLPSGETVVLNRGNLKLSDANQPIPSLNETVLVVQDREERRPLFARQNTPDRILWKDWTILRKALNLPDDKVPFFKVIRSEATDSSNVIREHVLSLDQIPNRHVEYIATWYSLAAFSFLMSFLRK